MPERTFFKGEKMSIKENLEKSRIELIQKVEEKKRIRTT